MRIISVGSGIIWKYRRITDKYRFPGFLWYIEENRCIMQGRDREKRGCTWEIHKKISGAKRKDEERWT